MRIITVLFILAPLGLAASGDAQEDRAKLRGSWYLENGRGGRTTWIIKDGASGLHITATDNAETIADFECDLGGRNCDVKIAGHKATVSIYFNGPALVELETIGTKVVKHRFSVLPSGNSMKLEEISMTGKEEVKASEFEREQLPQSKR